MLPIILSAFIVPEIIALVAYNEPSLYTLNGAPLRCTSPYSPQFSCQPAPAQKQRPSCPPPVFFCEIVKSVVLIPGAIPTLNPSITPEIKRFPSVLFLICHPPILPQIALILHAISASFATIFPALVT